MKMSASAVFCFEKGLSQIFASGWSQRMHVEMCFLVCTLRNFGFGLREIKPTEMNGTKKLVTVLGLAYEELQI